MLQFRMQAFNWDKHKQLLLSVFTISLESVCWLYKSKFLNLYFKLNVLDIWLAENQKFGSMDHFRQLILGQHLPNFLQVQEIVSIGEIKEIIRREEIKLY